MQDRTQDESASTQGTVGQAPSAQTGRSGGSRGHELKRSLAGRSYDEQAAALAPVQAKGAPEGGVHAAAEAGVRGAGGTLPHLPAIQQAFGRHDVSQVQAHVGGDAAQASKAMGATAYATGNHVAFGGSPDLHTAAHEAAHVVQQRGGVSLRGGVGQAGDSYEQHADAVADAVVAGKSAEGLLDRTSGGAGGGGVQKQVVQRDSISGDGDVSADERSAIRGTAMDRGGLLGTGEMNVRGTSQGVATVVSGVSMAENPDFERDAIAFEQNLGISAYSLGNGPAGEMAAKGKAYLMAKTGAAEWKASEARLATELVKLGSDNPAWSGTVGKAVDDLLAVFDSGNVATRMCHLENLWNMLAGDINLNSDMMDELLERAGILAADIQRFRDDKGGNRFHVPAGSEVEGQGKTRLENPNHNEHKTAMTVGSSGVTLGGAEAEVQVPGYDRSSGAPPETAALQWEEGGRIWMMNETNKWVHLMRQLSIPLAAGPSGTTNKLMNLGAVLGMDPFKTRLAAIGYLLPAHHHSLAEIMEAAHPHGANDFIRGRMMYTRINPWSASQLRGFGGGKFPHEGHRAAPVAAPQPA